MKCVGLVKFANDNIYWIVYDLTLDIAYPYLLTSEEREKYETMFDWWNQAGLPKRWEGCGTFTDEEVVDIYIDCAGGMYWRGTASESARLIISGTDTFEEGLLEINGKPEWACKFFEDYFRKKVQK